MSLLDSLQTATPLLDTWGIEDFGRGYRNLQGLNNSLGPVAFESLLADLGRILPEQADPDMALNNLERFFSHADARSRLTGLLQDHAQGLDTLLQLFGTSQFFADILARNPDYIESATVVLRSTPTTEELRQHLLEEVELATDDAVILRSFRRYRQRQLLRIGVNDIIRQRPLEEITKDLSRVADIAIAAAFHAAWKTITTRFGVPQSSQGLSRCAVLAFGKLGGNELNYSSDIDLMFVYDEDGFTKGRRGGTDNAEFYGRLVAEVIRLLSAHTDLGQAYRVDLRLRPEGQRGPLARSLASTLSYYDTLGRTWERQALIKVRPVAGEIELAQEFLNAVEPFVYKRFLSFAEINEIKAMKRKIEHKSNQSGDDEREVKTGRGGIRDIEFTIQFLQLLNGGDLNEVRKRNTLEAMHALEAKGCLTDQEYRGLDESYRFLRKTEHRLQILFDWQTHRLPEKPDALRKLAVRMGYSTRSNENSTTPFRAQEVGSAATETGVSVHAATETDGNDGDSRHVNFPQKMSPIDEIPAPRALDTRDLLFDPLEQFLYHYHESTRLNRSVLNHLLHQTFPDADKRAEPESDLILDPDPDLKTIQQVLGRYPFRNVVAAHANLVQLAQEQRFLSTRRCRHFLASIAPQLLRVVGEQSDPDHALMNLEKVTACLGGKAILWELFSFNPPSLKLYVDLCDSEYLSQILINNPGMIDDLLDSLILNRPRTREDLQAELTELCRGVERAEVAEPIFHSFQDKELLRIAVRDLLGKDDIRATTAAISDLAEVLLNEVIGRCETEVQKKFGVPRMTEGPQKGEICRYSWLGLGKLGGREMSYHSDLDLILIYEGEGCTEREAIDTFQYFTEFAQRVIRAMSHLGPMGRLYAVDMRLRPTGKSGSLVTPLHEFQRYYSSHSAQMWERQSLTRARPVFGDSVFAIQVMDVVRGAFLEVNWTRQVLKEIRSMRERLELTSCSRNLKRTRGGMTDAEFLVQAFLIKEGRAHPEIVSTNTWEVLNALFAKGLLNEADYIVLRESYSFHRMAEARLRISCNRPINEVPEAEDDLEKFARRMGFGSNSGKAADQFRQQLCLHQKLTREVFDRLLTWK